MEMHPWLGFGPEELLSGEDTVCSWIKVGGLWRDGRVARSQRHRSPAEW